MKREYGLRIVTRDLVQFSKVYLIPLADFHKGCRDAADDVIQGYIDWIKQRDNALTILNGDLMNCAIKDSTPDLFEDLVTPDEAYVGLKKMLHPIKGKILMITRGGHEEFIFRKAGTDYMARLAHDLRPDGVLDTDESQDIPYRPNGGMIGLRLSRNNRTSMFWIYATHGWGGARTIGAKIKKVEELAWAVDADCYVLSHDHTQAVHRLNMLVPPKAQISMTRPIYMRHSRKLLVNTGGFIAYSGYIQRKGYMPQDLGTPRIRLEIKKSGDDFYKDLHSSI